MNATDTLSEAQRQIAPDDAAAPEPTVSVWEGLSSEQLREIVRRGFAGGEHFAGAAAELERRAQERTAQAHQAEAKLDRRRRQILRLMMLAAMVATTAVWVAILIRWLG